MSQWGNDHPEEMAEIAALPPNQQNAALRASIGYDPDAIRDQYEERQRVHCHRPLNTSPGGDEPHPTSSRSGSASPGVDLSSRRRYAGTCDNCGAEEDRPCQPWCLGEQFS